jgi:hypothetical protein
LFEFKRPREPGSNQRCSPDAYDLCEEEKVSGRLSSAHPGPKNKNLGDASVQNATQLRASAELYLKVARRLSDRNARDQLHAVAAEIVAHTVELETQSGLSFSNSSGMAELQRARDFAANNPKQVIHTLRNGAPSRRVIQAKIGQELRALYSLPHELPHRILMLLTQLNGQKQKPPEGSSQ